MRTNAVRPTPGPQPTRNGDALPLGRADWTVYATVPQDADGTSWLPRRRGTSGLRMDRREGQPERSHLKAGAAVATRPVEPEQARTTSTVPGTAKASLERRC